METEDFYALDAMTMILSHGRSARMTQNIVNKGRAIQAWAYNPDTRYAGMVVLGGSPNEPVELKDKNITVAEKRRAYIKACKGVEEILLAEVEKMKTERVSRRELERIKKLNQRDFLDRMRSNESLAATMATLEVQVGWRYLNTYLDRIEAVTPEEIRRVTQKYFHAENRTSVYVIPGGKPDAPPEHYKEVRSITGLAAAKVIRTDRSTNNSIFPTPDGWKHPLSFERRPFKIGYPEAETATVEGATVFYLPDRELPLVDLTLLVRAGAVDMDGDKIGLAGLINETLIPGGTKKYSPSELALVLDENAIRLSVSVRGEDTVIRLSVIKDDWHKGLALLEEILNRPMFDPDALDVAKKQALVELKRQGGNAQAVVMREGMIWHFKGHPYGRDPLQGLKTIPAITREDLKGFLKKYLVPSNMVAAVAGDIEMTDVMKGLRRIFQTLPKARAPERKLDDPAQTPPVLAFIHKPGQVQSQLALLLPSLKRTHTDYWKMSLLMDIFGGNDSLMYTRLRADLGLIYSAGFYQTYKWQAGMLLGYIGCKGDSTSRAIRETVRIMGGLRKDVPEEQLEQKRLDALNSFVFNVNTPSELVGVYGRYYMRNEPLDTLEKIQDDFIRASKEELEALAERFPDPKRLQVFIVGDKGTRVIREDGTEVTLEEDIKTLAKTLGLPYKEIKLR
jgi:zinc protease